MSGFYRFPALANLDEFTSRDQVEYMKAECEEAIDAYWGWDIERDVPGSVQRV